MDLKFRKSLLANLSELQIRTARAWWAYGLLALFVNLTGTPAAAAGTLRLLALGDSLTAGYNLPPADSFPSRLEAALVAEGYSVQVINAGVSGDTTAGGRARLEWVLSADAAPDAAIVALGANDALRGIDPAIAYDNLDAILTTLQRRHVKVLLAGMLAPRNLGADYAKAFDAIYPRLSAAHGVPLYPFFLDGVALHSELVQADGMHPTAPGVAVMVRNILPAVNSLLGPPPAPPPGGRR
jgi:acyl-CoA thioesterase-1